MSHIRRGRASPALSLTAGTLGTQSWRVTAPATSFAPTRPRLPLAALGIFVAAGVAFVAAQSIEAGNHPHTQDFLTAVDLAWATATFGIAVIGLYVLAVRPGHRTGWLLLLGGSAFAFGLLAHAVAIRLLLVADRATALGHLAAWFASFLIPLALGLAILAPATWPTGRIDGPRMRLAGTVAAVAVGVVVVTQAFAPDHLDAVVPADAIANPLGIALLDPVAQTITVAAAWVLLVYFVVALVDLAVRSARVGRHGLRPLVIVVALAAAALGSVAVRRSLGDGGWLVMLLMVALAGVGLLVVVALRAERRQAVAEDARLLVVAEREDERRRVRADLHDGLGPLLAALRLELDGQPDDDPALRRARELVVDAIGEVRRISRDLRPVALDDLGLVGAIERQTGALGGSGRLQVDVMTDPTPLPALPASVEVAAYRIISEAATNVVRHAAATTCSIRILLSGPADGEQMLSVAICDDGVGTGAAEPGVGIASMRDRAEELGGSLEITAGHRGGTQVHVEIPVPR